MAGKQGEAGAADARLPGHCGLGLSPAARKYLEALPATQRKLLTQAVVDCEAHQRERVERAIDKAVDHVPMLLRGVVKKFLLG